MLTAREACIEAYLDAGYRLFDCYTHDKTPCIKDWQNAPAGYRPTSVTYGVPLGDDDLILDYDSRRDPQKTQLKDFWNECQLENMPTTFLVQTKDGYHIYGHKPLDWKVRGSTVPGYPAIEIKSKGRYVIGAGSLHPSGIYYQVYSGTPKSVVDFPQSILVKCKKPDEMISSSPGVCDDSEATQQRYIQWIRDGGHVRGLFEVACTGKDYGLSAGTMEQIIYTHCNPFWETPATLADIRDRIDHAFLYGQNLPGSKNTASTAFASVAAESNNCKHGNRILEIFEPLWDQAIGKYKDPESGETKTFTKGIKPSTPSILAQCAITNYRDSRNPTVEIINPLFDLFRFNQFSQDIEFKHAAPWHYPNEQVKAWRQVDSSLMSVWLSQHTPIINPEEKQIERAVLALAYNDQYHPVKQYLRSITWDGTPRLDTWLTTYAGSPDTIYIREIGKNTLIAACARVETPGCQHDSSLVFEGEQDAGKTSIVRILGGEHYADVRIDPRQKDTFINMLGNWFMELSEMAFMREVDVEATKRFLTITTDVLRLPYERRGIKIPRQSIFTGTVNPKHTGYLRDITGNRRFWVCPTGEIDLEGLREVRDQLFAEAFQRFQAGEKWHITNPQIRQMAKAEAEKRLVKEVWQEDIEAYLNDPNTSKPDALTTRWIALYILGISPQNKDHRVQTRIAHAMQMLGYQNVPRRTSNGSQRVWVSKRFIDLEGF